MRTLLLGWLLLLAAITYAQTPTTYSRVQIDLTGHDIAELAAMGLDVDHGTYAPGRFFTGDFSATDIAMMEQAGFSVSILIADVQHHYVQQNWNIAHEKLAAACGPNIGDYTTPQNFSLGSMGGFFTYEEMLEHLDSMAAKYPNIISPRQAIDSSNLTHENRMIYWLRISDNPNQDESEPEALYTALHHAREPGSLSQTIFYMWYLLENYDTDPEIQYLIDNTELYFVPCVNPDGYIYNQINDPNGGGLWRKNRRNNGNGTYGVDLNRNYGYEWAFDNTGSSPSTNSDTYRGPSAFSEPETQNIRDFCNAHNFKIALNYHTYGNLLVHPWGYSDQQTPDSTIFRGFAGYMTRENNFTTGTGTETVGYVTNGDSDDWMYGETGSKPAIYSLTPEAGEGAFGFWPPSGAIESICKENMHQNLAVPRLLLNFGELTNTTPPETADTTGFVYFNLQRLGLQSGNLEVAATPLSSHIATVGNAKNYTLNQFETVADSISYTLSGGLTSGERIRVLLTVNNGVASFSDTVTILYGLPDVLFTDAATSLSNWNPNGWNTTTNDYVSAPTSITESPKGNYGNNYAAVMNIASPIDLTDTASQAVLRFWAKWDIEEGYDYVQLLASTDGSNYTALCGQYTTTGTIYQEEDEPVYDGKQNTWVQEQIDISEYLGGNLYLRFYFESDQYQTGDGFYLDDLEVLSYITGYADTTVDTTIIAVPEIPEALGQAYPNPARSLVIIPAANPNAAQQLVVTNLLGEVVETVTVTSPQIELDVASWPAGTYLYRLSGSTETKRFVVVR